MTCDRCRGLILDNRPTRIVIARPGRLDDPRLKQHVRLCRECDEAVARTLVQRDDNLNELQRTG